jgi:hypothetical protein
MMLSITIDGDPVSIPYTSPSEILEDACLRALFDSGMVTDCRATVSGLLVFKLPAVVMTWDRLRDSVIANSSTLLDRAKGG